MSVSTPLDVCKLQISSQFFELQVIKDTVENESKYDWFQFTGETASTLGFESRDALTKVAQECEELEVNSFYGAVSIIFALFLS